MKKGVSIVLFFLLLCVFTTTVKATTASEKLYDYIAGTFMINGQEIKVFTSTELAQAKRYFDTHEISENQYIRVKKQMDKIVEIMDTAKVTNIFDLEGENKEKMISALKLAAEVLKLEIDYDSVDKTFLIKDEYKKIVGTFVLENDKLVQTDLLHYEYLITPILAIIVISIAIPVVYKKVNDNV